jgi:hypothetical protein
MSKQETEEVIRVHIWIYARDWERLHDIYGKTLRPSKAIRAIIRSFLSGLESRIGAAENALGELDL